MPLVRQMRYGKYRRSYFFYKILFNSYELHVSAKNLFYGYDRKKNGDAHWTAFFVVLSSNFSAEKASSFLKFKNVKFHENGTRFIPEDDKLRNGVPTVLAIVECRQNIQLTVAKAYYYDREKKMIGSSEVASYYRYTKSGILVGLAKLPSIEKNEAMDFHFAPPQGINLKDGTRIVVVIGNKEIIQAEVEPNDSPDKYDFPEKDIYTACH